jgi:integrase
MKNRCYLSRLRSKETGRFIPFPSAIIDAFVGWCCQRGISAIKVRRYADHLRRLRPQFRWRQKANLLNLTVDDLGDVQQFCRVRRASFVRGIAVFGSFLQGTGRLSPSEPIRRIRPRGYRWYRRVPIFGPIMDDFVAWSVARGSSPSTIQMHLRALRDLAPRFLGMGKRTCRDFGEDDLVRARQFFRTQPEWRAGVLRLGDYLRGRGWLKPGGCNRRTLSGTILGQFNEHLKKDRGLAESTIQSREKWLHRFLSFIGVNRGMPTLRELKLETVHRFLRRTSQRCSRRTMKNVTGIIRGFLRFQHMKGVLRHPLHSQIDSVRVYREELLPHPLPWSELQKLLKRMDRSTPLGSRDFTILLLAASYGLRRSEIAALTLDEIDWRTRTLNIFQSKTRQTLALPITVPIGRALVDYLRKGRPASEARQLFLRQRAPAGPLGAPGVACALARAVRSTGAKIETTSFHGLRHAFALRLLRRGTALKGISDLLGHRDPNSTATYLRLNVEDLCQVALPAPMAISPTTNPDQALVSMPATKAARRPKGTVTDPLGWRSFLARQIGDYLAIQRALGRAFRSEEWVLLTLDQVLARDFPNGHIFTANMFEKWAEVHAVVSPTTRRYRMLCVRKFCRHLARFRPATFIPDVRTFPRKHDHQAPFLLTRSEVGRIISKTATLKVGWQNSFRRPTMCLAWVILYCCGLRRGELLRLRLADVDMEHSVLRINETKFYKTRLVPFSRSVGEEIRLYLGQRRRRGFPMNPSTPLLWNGREGKAGGPISPATLVSNWIGACQAAGVFTHFGRTPRIHDLRHSFAVEALRRGYRMGSHPQATLPRLARYLGHVSPDFTHHYLKFTEPLRTAAGKRFHRQVVGSLFRPAQHRHQKGNIA